MKSQLITALVDRIFNPKLCPETNKLFLGQKYALPNYRQPDYINQDFLNRFSLTTLLLCVTPGSEAFFDDVMKGAISNVMLAAKCGRPTLFLERELGDVLIKSKLPLDLSTSDIKFPWPSTRIILPKNLLNIKRNDFEASMMFLDIGFLAKGEEARCPMNIAKEIDYNASIHFGVSPNRIQLRGLNFDYPDDAITINGALDKGETDIAPTAYGLTKPWRKDAKLMDIKELKGLLDTGFICDESDNSLLQRMENLALNILILLSAVPIEYIPDHIERRAKLEGKRLIPALLRPKWVGDHLLRARHVGAVKGELTGRTNAAHWVSPHWRRQPFGKGFTLRKLIWILPYHTGPVETESKQNG